MTEFDDLFADEFKDDKNKDEEKKVDKKNQSSAPGTSSEELLSDFDSLFDQPSTSSGVSEKTEHAEVPPKAASTDDLFDDFILNNEPEESLEDSTGLDSPTIVGESAKAPTAQEQFKEPEELEDLFAEESAPKKDDIDLPSDADDFGADIIDSAALTQFDQKKKSKLRVVVIAVASLLSISLVAALSLARFSKDGFLGWKLGSRSQDGYEPPSSKVLAQLNSKLSEVQGLFAYDSHQKYAEIVSGLEGILRIDSRHYPSLQILGEALLIKADASLDEKNKKTVEKIIADSEKFFPDKLETFRVKARYKMVSDSLAEAESLLKKVFEKSKMDAFALQLAGEIYYKKQDWESANNYLTQLITQDPKSIRAPFFQALVLKEQGKQQEADAILMKLFDPAVGHVKSELVYLSSKVSQNQDLLLSRDALLKVVTEKTAMLSAYDLGNGWDMVANAYISLADTPMAIQSMENSLRQDPVNHQHAFKLGGLYMQTQQYDKAVDQFNRAVVLSSKNAEYLVRYGQALRENGRPEIGIIEINKALEITPDYVEGTLQQALTLRKLSRFDESMTSFESVLQRKPDYVLAMVELGELYMDKNNFQAAETQFRNALAINAAEVRATNNLGLLFMTKRKYPDALAMFQKAEKIDSKNVEVISNLGKINLVMGNRKAASDYFEKALAIDPARVDTQIALGDLHRESGDCLKAMEVYRLLIQSNPKNYEARIRLAMCHIYQDAFQEAITELQEASKYKSEYFPTKLQLGIAWRGLGDLDASLETLRVALNLRPESPEAYYELEMTHIYRNDILSAEDAMEKAVKYDPHFVDPYVAIAEFYKGRNYTDKAIEFYLKALSVGPKLPKLHYALAELYKTERRYALAKKYYLQTLKYDPQFSLAYVGLGLLAEEDNKIAEASRYYQQAKKYDPKNPRPYYYLGFIYRNLGNKQAAIASLTEYLQLDPQSKEREDVLEQITNLKRK